MFSEERFIAIKITLIVVIIFLATIGIRYIIDIEEFVEHIEYYENGIKIDAIEYHNEIYLISGLVSFTPLIIVSTSLGKSVAM